MDVAFSGDSDRSDQGLRMKVLVTGGAGFIGSHLVRALLHKGHEVRVVDNLSTGKRENIAEIESDIEFSYMDLSDPQTAREACSDVDTVFHVAALPSVPRSIKFPGETHRNGIELTFRLLEAARLNKVRRFIFSSSSSVYGGLGPFPQAESLPSNPMSPYAASKVGGEALVRGYAQCYDMDAVSLRYFNVFGPRQDPHSQYAGVFPSFIMKMLQGLSPEVFGDGCQTRDFTHVNNVVYANILAAERSERLGGIVMNIGAGERVSVMDLVRAINGVLGTQLEPLYKGPRPGDVRDSHADISSAREELGYEIVTDFEVGLREIIEWYRQEERPLLDTSNAMLPL